LMAQFSTRVRKLGTLPAISMKQIYLNPTIRQLAIALGDTDVGGTSGGGASARVTGRAAAEIVRGSSVGHVMTGVSQFLVFLAVTYLGAVVLTASFGWLSTARDVTGAPVLADMARRSAVLVGAIFVATLLLPVA